MSFLVLINKPPHIPDNLANFASEHDPYFKLVGMHTTLIFPTPVSVGIEELLEHIEKVLENWESFPVQFDQLEKSWDHWLFITPSIGKEKIIQLHDDLYTGLMKPFLREDIPFVPHLALGLFANRVKGYNPENPREMKLDTKTFNDARNWAENQKPDISYEFNDCVLLELDDRFTHSKQLKHFALAKEINKQYKNPGGY